LLIKELAFKTMKKNDAVELGIANKELAFENKRKRKKEKRCNRVKHYNIELLFKIMRKKTCRNLSIATIELAFQNEEKKNV
jgi:hypothetical protein